MGESMAGRAERRPKVIGRVGALAVLLGVGTAIAVPATAHAETGDSSSPSTSSQESAGADSETAGTLAESRISKPPASSAPDSTFGSATTSRRGLSETSNRGSLRDDEDDGLDAGFDDDRVLRSGSSPTAETGDEVGTSTVSPEEELKSSAIPSGNRSKVPVETEPAAPWSKLRATSVTASTPAVPESFVREQATPSPLTEVVVAPQDVLPEPTVAIPSEAPAVSSDGPAEGNVPLVQTVGNVISAVFAPLAGTGVAPDAPHQSPTAWALLAFARRQAGHDPNPGGGAAAAPASLTTTALQVPDAAVAQDDLVNQGSPLVTPEQLQAEKTAMRTAQTLPVQLMKLFLAQQFRSTAQQEFAAVGGVNAQNLALLNAAVDQFALFSSFTQQLLNPMDPKFLWADTPAHSWFGMDVGDSRYLYDNPDTIYRFTGVNKNASYVITGRFHNYDPNDPDGTLPADTTFSVVEGTSGETSSLLTADQLEIAPDGTFVITVSGDPAAPGKTNHIQLTSNSTVLLARNTLGDWNIEEPMSLSIAKVGGAPNSLFAQLGGFSLLGGLVNDNPLLVSLLSLVPPLPIAEIPLVRGTLTALIMVVRGGNEQAKYIALATTDPVTGDAKPANFIPQPTSNAEFLANQRQSIGNVQLADDEALVLTIDPGGAGYFVVPVYNVWTTTADFWDQQTSLNNAQTLMNADGTYTVVISPNDPGVYNWVSTGGLNQGIIAARFQDIDEDGPDAPRIVSYQVVPVGEAASFFADESYLVTAEERADQLALRRAGYNKRYAPYPQV